MFGNIRRRGNRWQASIEIPRDDGRRKRIYRSFTTERAANLWLSERFLAVGTGAFVKPTTRTLAEAHADYRAEVRHSAMTNYVYAFYSQRMVSEFGGVALQAISTRMLERFVVALYTTPRLDGRPGSLGERTINSNIQQMKAFFAWAKAHDYVERDVAATIKWISRTHVREMVILDVEETKALLAAAKGSRLEAGIWLGATAGLRRGEVLGLAWRDVDLVAGRVSVQHSLSVRPHGQEMTRVKTVASRRTLKLSTEATEVLARIRQQQLVTFHSAPEFVCPSPDGLTHWRPGPFSQAFASFLKGHRKRHMRFHDLRHTHASLLIAAGVHIKVISVRLGHASITITMDLYGHLIPGIEDGAVGKFEALLQDAPGGIPPAAA